MSKLRVAIVPGLIGLLGSCNSVLDPDGAGVQSQTIVNGGLIRHYEWTAPNGAVARPVLLVFHGLGGNATEIRSTTGPDAAQCRTGSPDERKTFGGTQVGVMKQDQCDGGVSVERHRVIALTHVWPEGSYSATREILRFFGAH